MYRIMLADDEGIVIDSLRFIIEKEFGQGCMIESAKTGRSVIELAEHFRPDIAIMDIQMPGINGIEAMREIKKTNSNTMFIVISAYDKFDYAKEAINLGVLEYLNKPIERGKVIQVLKKAMGLIDGEREKRSNELLIKEKMETVVPIIENGFLYTLLFQEYFEEDILNYKQLLGIESEYGFMAVLVCGERQEGNHMTNAVGASVRVQNSYRDVRETVREYYPDMLMSSVMSNKIAMYLPRKKEELDYNERIEVIEKSRELVRKLKKRTNVVFRLGIGSIRHIHEAMTSYNEALTSLIDTTNAVAHVDDLPLKCTYADNYPIDVEKRIFERVEKGDLNGAITSANSFFDWMEENFETHIIDIRLKVLELVLWAERLAYLSGGMTYHFLSREEYLPALLKYETLEELRTWFVDKLSEACRRIVVKIEEQSVGVVSQAKRFIDTHYTKDISLDDVSREVDISPYYFSKIFKDETGENFIEYVTNIRIEKAKELLASSEYSMKEIGCMIGYSDPNYFSRAFKKNVGVTPTEYKEGRI
ncbi:response regulator transcription factor [Anaerosporobacter sp.]|uniref:response regulator transcription factor n=1 Tax=Anaerosporobacter sp. TaxID=1872529 RepID=UPI00286F2EF0|nr:response regulator [Anaerosporobacter sp.]